MKPFSREYSIAQALDDAEKFVATIVKSDLIIELAEDYNLIFTRIHQAAENLLMTEDQFNQAGTIVKQILRFKIDGKIKLSNLQEKIIRDTLAKIQLNRTRLNKVLIN